MVVIKKYIIYGMYMKIKYDNQTHFISVNTVMGLYKLNPSECYCIDVNNDNWQDRLKGLKLENFIELHPRDDGDYDLNEVIRRSKN